MSRPAEVALLSSPGSPPGLILRAEETSDRLRSRRSARRGASPPPPPISRRTSLTLSSFSAATLTTPLLPMTLPLPPTTTAATPNVVSVAATMPSNVAAWPPRRTSARLAALAASAVSATDVATPLPSSDRKRPAARRRRTPPMKRCKTSQEDLIALAEDDAKMAAAHPPSSPESAVCCICLSSLHDHVDTARLVDCPHEFCTPCILQWSRTENSCPLCKQRFTQILSKAASSKQRVRRIAVPHRNQRSETGRVLDSILQSLQQHAGAGGTGAAVGRIHIGMTAIGNGPWMLTAGTGGDGELEDFLRRFFVTTTGHSADTAIEIPDAAQETVELE